MRAALEQAQRSLEAGEIPVGCVIVKKGSGEIVATGHNLTNKTRNGTRHAEMNAIDTLVYSGKYSPNYFHDCELYVTCEPCIMCAAALARVGIQKVYFGCGNDRFGGNGSILSVHTDDRIGGYTPYPIESGLMKEEAIEIFQRFYTSENRRAPEEKRKKKRKQIDVQSNDGADL